MDAVRKPSHLPHLVPLLRSEEFDLTSVSWNRGYTHIILCAISNRRRENLSIRRPCQAGKTRSKEKLVATAHGELTLSGAVRIRDHQTILIFKIIEKGQLLSVGRKRHRVVNPRQQFSDRAPRTGHLEERSSGIILFLHRVVDVVAVRRERHSAVVEFRRWNDLGVAVKDGHLLEPEALLSAIVYDVHQPSAVRRDRGSQSFARACQPRERCRLQRQGRLLLPVHSQ